MLDNFRRNNPHSTRLQSPYSRLQEALSEAGDESAKAEGFGMEAPNADSRGDPEPSRSGRESVSKLIVGPDIKLKGAEITDCDTLVVEGRVEASMDSRVMGKVSGKVRYGKVAMEEGGEISGDIAALAETKSAGVARAADSARSPAATPAASALAQAGAQPLPSKPAWTSQTGTPPQSKPAGASQGGAQPQPNKPAAPSH